MERAPSPFWVRLGTLGAAAGLFALLAAEVPARAEEPAEPAKTQPPAAHPPAATPPPPAATVLNKNAAQGVLGREIRSAAGEDMGHIVDVIVDRAGEPRAAVIDFGGFLGVGSRKIAVDWAALHFAPAGQPQPVVLELTRDQLKNAPEYKEGKPIVVLGASGSAEPASPEYLPMMK